MRAATRFVFLFVLCALTASLAGCDLLGDDGAPEGQPLPKGPALVASVAGNTPGLWLFNPESLERTSISKAVGERYPFSTAFSPDYRRWYITFDGADGSPRLALLNAESGKIAEQVRSAHVSLSYDAYGERVIAYGNNESENAAQIFDATSLERIGTVAAPRDAMDVVAGPDALYLGARASFAPEALIHIVDAETLELNGSIRLIEDPELRKYTRVWDLARSPSGDYLFATAFTSSGVDGIGHFFVIDLDTRELVFEHRPVGKLAQIAVSPEGRHIYLDCPAGGNQRRLYTPTEKVFHYDVEKRKLNVLIDEAEDMGLTSRGLLTTDQITMLPGGDQLVMKITGAGTANDEIPLLARVDAETGEALQTFVPERDDRGYFTETVRRMSYSVVPE